MIESSLHRVWLLCVQSDYLFSNRSEFISHTGLCKVKSTFSCHHWLICIAIGMQTACQMGYGICIEQDSVYVLLHPIWTQLGWGLKSGPLRVHDAAAQISSLYVFIRFRVDGVRNFNRNESSFAHTLFNSCRNGIFFYFCEWVCTCTYTHTYTYTYTHI